MRLTSRDGESRTEARRRVAREALESLSEAGGGVAVLSSTPGLEVDLMTEAFGEMGADLGYRVHRFWGDKFERNVSLSTIERMRSRSRWLADIGPTSIRDVDPIDFAREVVERYMQLHQQAEKSRPNTLIVLGAAQFMDADSVTVLRYAIPRLMYLGVNFVIGHTCTGNSVLARFIADLIAHEDNVVSVELTSLAASEVRQKFIDLIDVELAPDAVQEVLNRTAGIPSAVRYVIAEMEPSEILQAKRSGHLAADNFDRVSDFDRAQWEKASSETKLIAASVALAGRALPQSELIEICDRLGISFTLEEACERCLLTLIPESKDVVLMYMWVAAAVKTTLDEGEQARVHAALAKVSEQGHVRHRLASEAQIGPTNLRLLLDHAADLEASGHPREASDLLQTAAGRSDDSDTAERLIIEVVNIHRRHLLYFTDTSILQRVRELPDGSPVRMYTSLWVRLLSAGSRRAKLEDVHYRSPGDSARERWLHAETLLGAILVASYRNMAAFAAMLVDAQVAYAGREDETVEEFSWVNLPPRRVFLDALELYLAPLDDAGLQERLAMTVDLARSLPNNLADRFDTLVICAQFYLARGEGQRAGELVDEALESFDKLDEKPVFHIEALRVRTTQDLRIGKWDRASASCEFMLEHLLVGVDPWKRSAVPALAATIASARGEQEKARELLEQAREAHDLLSVAISMSDTLAVAECEIALHDRDFERILEIGDRWSKDPGVSGSALFRLRRHLALLELGRVEEARRVLDDVTVLDRALGNNHVSTVAAHTGRQLVRENRYAEAKEAFDQGLREALSPLDLARNWAGLAELALLDPDGNVTESEVNEYLDQAQAELVKLGARGYEDQIGDVRRLLADRFSARRASLTDRERTIAHLAAQGWTNVEIAAEVKMSRSSVALSISRILHKLGIMSRKKIADILAS